MLDNVKCGPNPDAPNYSSFQRKSEQIETKLEDALDKIQRSETTSSLTDTDMRFPSLLLTNSAIESMDDVRQLSSKPIRSIPSPRQNSVSSEIVFKNITSNTSIFSEEEQSEMNTKAENSTRPPNTGQRRCSNTSDRTLVVTPSNLFVDTVFFNKIHRENNLDADDEGELKSSENQLNCEEDELTDQEEYHAAREYSEEPVIKDSKNELESNLMTGSVNKNTYKKETGKLTSSRSTGDLLDEKTSLKKQLKYSETFSGTEPERKNYRESKTQLEQTLLAPKMSSMASQQGEVSSDDEVKDYLTTNTTNYDEISHV